MDTTSMEKRYVSMRDQVGRSAGGLSQDYYYKIVRPMAWMGYEIGVLSAAGIFGIKNS